MSGCPRCQLGVEDFLDGVAGHGIEEEDDEGGKQGHYQQLHDHPLVVVPQDVAQRLQWVQEPHERRVRPTENHRQVKGKVADDAKRNEAKRCDEMKCGIRVAITGSKFTRMSPTDGKPEARQK